MAEFALHLADTALTYCELNGLTNRCGATESTDAGRNSSRKEGSPMGTRLSDKLADLSVAARKAEDSAAKAQKETSEKIQSMKDEAHSKIDKRISALDAKLADAKEETSSDLNSWKSKVQADMAAVKGRIENKKHEVDVKHKVRHADRLENDAEYAVEYAIYSTEVAEAAILDAIEARLNAVSAEIG